MRGVIGKYIALGLVGVTAFGLAPIVPARAQNGSPTQTDAQTTAIYAAVNAALAGDSNAIASFLASNPALATAMGNVIAGTLATNVAGSGNLATALANTGNASLISGVMVAAPTAQAAIATAVVATGNATAIATVVLSLNSSNNPAAVTAVANALARSPNSTLVTAVAATVQANNSTLGGTFIGQVASAPGATDAAKSAVNTQTVQNSITQNPPPQITIPNPAQVKQGSAA